MPDPAYPTAFVMNPATDLAPYALTTFVTPSELRGPGGAGST